MSIWLFQYDESIYLNDCVNLGRFLSNRVAVYLVRNSRSLIVTIIYQLQLAALNIFQKIKAIWVLQTIVYGGSCFILIDSGKGLYNM